MTVKLPARKEEIYATFHTSEHRTIDVPVWIKDMGDHNKLPSPISPTPMHPLDVMHALHIWQPAFTTSYWIAHLTRSTYERDADNQVVYVPNPDKSNYRWARDTIPHKIGEELCMPSFIPDAYRHGKCYWLHNCAILEMSNGQWHIESEAADDGTKTSRIVYDPPIYYRVGCPHTNLVESNPRMHEHVYTCPDCGYSWSTDSSG